MDTPGRALAGGAAPDAADGSALPEDGASLSGDT
jgi:hypothetical protein